jgi:hypothetical protein
MDAKINNVIYMELYSGPKMMDDEYLKSNIARSIDRDSIVFYSIGMCRMRIPLACAECDDSLPFSGAFSIPPCHKENG